MGWVVGVRHKEGGAPVYLWLIHTIVWLKPTQHCKAIILPLKKKINSKNKKTNKNPCWCMDPVLQSRLEPGHHWCPHSQTCRCLGLILLSLSRHVKLCHFPLEKLAPDLNAEQSPRALARPIQLLMAPSHALACRSQFSMTGIGNSILPATQALSCEPSLALFLFPYPTFSSLAHHTETIRWRFRGLWRAPVP